MIAGAPCCPRTLPEATALAETLVTLLPGSASVGVLAQVRQVPTLSVPFLSARPSRPGQKVNWVLVLGLMLAVAVAWLVVDSAFGSPHSDDRLSGFGSVPTEPSH